MKFILLSFLLFSSSSIAQNQRKLGLIADPVRYNALPSQAGLIKGDELPASASLEPFCPTVGDQGPYGTCAAFSTCYNMMAIREAVRRNVTTPTAVNEFRCSPGYIFEKIKKSTDTECQQGGTLPDVIGALYQFGVPLLSDMAYPSCGQSTSVLDTKAQAHRIPDKFICTTQQKFSPEQQIAITQAVLSKGMPVVFGLHALPSFIAGQGDVWNPAPNEQPQDGDGHAMCLVGYDNTRYGGAFRLINSWGANWGDRGFYWIRYRDFIRYNMGAVAVFPDPPSANTAHMQAQVAFRLRDGQAMAVKRTTTQRGMGVADDPATPGRVQSLVLYRMAQAYPSATAFKCYINNDQPAYVYVLNSDGRSLNPLFPYAADISPALLPKNTLVLPSERKSIVLDDTPGKEQVLFLFSKKPLDLNAVTQAISAGSGSFSDRILTTLGSELIPSTAINYNNDRVGFRIERETTGSIVPLLIEVEHQ